MSFPFDTLLVNFVNVTQTYKYLERGTLNLKKKKIPSEVWDTVLLTEMGGPSPLWVVSLVLWIV